MRLPVLSAFVCAATLAVASTSAYAKTITVDPDPGNTPIADAVAQLGSGDKLVLNAGTYDERLVLAGLSRVKVMGKGEVIIEAPAPSPAISITDCSKLRLQGLTVRDAPFDGIAIDNSTKVTVKSCIIESPSSASIDVSNSAKTSIQKCTLTGGTDGIEMSGASSAKISGNSITGPSGRGIYVFFVTLPGTKISKNDVSGAGTTGIELSGPGNKAEKNTVTDCLFGIHTPPGGADMSGSSITKNTIVDTAVALRTYASGGLVISKNTVRDSSASAMQIAPGAEDVQASKNTIDGANAGIDDEATRSQVSRNKITGTNTYGIRARGTDGRFTKNTVNDTPGAGFHVWTGSNTFTKNTATGNTGVDLDSTRVAEGANTYVRNEFDSTAF